MSMARTFAAEFKKLLSLPATLVAMCVSVVFTLGITVMNAFGIKSDIEQGRLDQLGYTSPVEAVFSAVPIGTIGAIVIGVIIVSQEYTANSTDAGGGRQISATLTATPGRTVLLVSKILVTITIVGIVALVTTCAALVCAHLVLEGSPENDISELAARTLGTAIYWSLIALISLAFTMLTRNGIAPLMVMITGSSVVSLSVLLANVTPLAFYLPDIAGMRMFTSESNWAFFDRALPPVQGGLVMGAWAVLFLVIAGIVFRKRDA